MSIVEELKRRNVFRVAVAYVIIAWLILQVGDTLAPALHLPETVNTVLAFFLILGFPLAIFLAWAYELTPEGLKKEKDVDRTKSITHVTSRKLDYFIIAVLVLALGYFTVDKFVLDPSREAELVQATTEAVTEQATESGKEEAADKSIAVLPFVNMSDDAANEYFSDGISEELLNLLTKIPELRVIARTSSFAYKGKDVKIADIARELNVGHVLEGSVRKSGNQVRITAQLIHAADSSHLWSETYDRTLDDIFAIQDEIAAAVVEQLKVTLLGAAPPVRKTNPEAYALYLQARQVSRQDTREAYEQSITLYQLALVIAPDFAEAWVGQATNHFQAAYFGQQPYDEAFTSAREATDKALAIDPDNALAHALLGGIALFYDGDLDAAARHFQHSLELEPANPDIISMAAFLVANLGRLDEAIALREYVVSRDPVNPRGYFNLGDTYLFARRLDEAIASLRTALTLSPEYVSSQYRIGVALLSKDEPEAALAAMQQESVEAYRLFGLSMAYHALGQGAGSDAALAELVENYEQIAAYNIAYVLAFRSEADRAFVWLDKAVEYKDSGLSRVPVEILFANIHTDPRWLPFLESIGKSPQQLDDIEFEVTLPE
jgi:TolB-like protein/Flp pilus assembly protein TadD